VDDGAGNIVVHVQDVTVHDTTAPAFTRTPEDVEVECNCDTFPEEPDIDAVDNCYDDVSIIFAEKKIDVQNDDVYKLVRTWSTQDSSGNQNSHDQTISVVDYKKPVFSAYPQDLYAVQCDEVPPAALVRARDNCDDTVESKLTSETDYAIDEQCSSRTVINTWAATDRSGNAQEHTQSVHIVDDESPVHYEATHTACLYPPNQKYVVYESASQLFHTADNCADDVVVTLTNCTSNQPEANAETVDGFDQDCHYSAATDKLYIKAERNENSGVARVYKLDATLSDHCDNEVSVHMEFIVPFDADNMIQLSEDGVTGICEVGTEASLVTY
jgi:hypothetical protein